MPISGPSLPLSPATAPSTSRGQLLGPRGSERSRTPDPTRRNRTLSLNITPNTAIRPRHAGQASHRRQDQLLGSVPILGQSI
eukprot:5248732-Pyramimonas_sp.AAC.1